MKAKTNQEDIKKGEKAKTQDTELARTDTATPPPSNTHTHNKNPNKHLCIRLWNSRRNRRGGRNTRRSSNRRRQPHCRLIPRDLRTPSMLLLLLLLLLGHDGRLQRPLHIQRWVLSIRYNEAQWLSVLQGNLKCAAARSEGGETTSAIWLLGWEGEISGVTLALWVRREISGVYALWGLGICVVIAFCNRSIFG